MQNNEETKKMAQTLMTKAFLTFVTSETLEGYEGGGKTFLQAFNMNVREHLIKQEKALREGTNDQWKSKKNHFFKASISLFFSKIFKFIN